MGGLGSLRDRGREGGKGEGAPFRRFDQWIFCAVRDLRVFEWKFLNGLRVSTRQDHVDGDVSHFE